MMGLAICGWALLKQPQPQEHIAQLLQSKGLKEPAVHPLRGHQFKTIGFWTTLHDDHFGFIRLFFIIWDRWKPFMSGISQLSELGLRGIEHSLKLFELL